MAILPLLCGRTALIDDADLARITGYRWIGRPAQTVTYVGASVALGQGRVRYVLLHRLLMAPAPGLVVDHINGDGLDNRRSNLRLCAAAQNALNTAPYRKRPDQGMPKGVYRSGARYAARIQKDGVVHSLGRFAGLRDAMAAYNDAAVRLHGEFARLHVLPDVAGPASQVAA